MSAFVDYLQKILSLLLRKPQPMPQKRKFDVSKKASSFGQIFENLDFRQTEYHQKH